MVPEVGRIILAKIVLGQHTLEHSHFALAKDFTATPDSEKDIADFTECDFDAYARITDPDFDDPTLNVARRAESFSELLTWTRGPVGITNTVKVLLWLFEIEDMSLHLFGFKKIVPTVTLAFDGEVFQRKVWYQDTDLVVA